MYVNYGDRDFFEHGRLVDAEHSDTEFSLLVCDPYEDEEDLYQFGDITIDVTDDWIDKKAVMSFIGMTDETYDPIEYAIGCVDYYGIENFGPGYWYDWRHMRASDIKDILKHRLIASDNLDICW